MAAIIQLTLYLVAAGAILYKAFLPSSREIDPAAQHGTTPIRLHGTTTSIATTTPSSELSTTTEQTNPAQASDAMIETITTEAISLTGAGEYHIHGIRGGGIKVAVIDNQFSDIDRSVNKGELPISLVRIGFAGGYRTLRFETGESGHGTACAEIIHDLAPDAQLFLIQTPDLEENFAAILEYMVIEHIDIVNISLSMPAASEAFYDLLRDARIDHDILIIASAGNHARNSGPTEGSLAIPADSPHVLAVGAADAVTGQLLATSSQGPTGDGRIKPDVVSFTNVSTSVEEFGTRGFSGTSAAAPHIAGMAALLWSTPGVGRLKIDQQLDRLLSLTEDRGIPGLDNSWGSGIATLPIIVGKLTVHPSDEQVYLKRFNASTAYATVRVQIQRSDSSNVLPSDKTTWYAESGGHPIVINSIRPIGDYLYLDLIIPTMLWDTRNSPVPVMISWTNLSASAQLVPSPQELHVDNHIVLNFQMSGTQVSAGSLMPLYASLHSRQSEVDAMVVAEIIDPTGHVSIIPLLDDGHLADRITGDTVYSALLTQLLDPGRYVINIHATGINTDGHHYDVTSTNTLFVNADSPDSDWDGIPDVWEITMATDPTRDDAGRDDDDDQLNTLDEYLNGTNPLNWDSDGDGLLDYEELSGYYVTAPYSADTDGGGVIDFDELQRQTNPHIPGDDYQPDQRTYLPITTRPFVPPYSLQVEWVPADNMLWAATDVGVLAYDTTSQRVRVYTGNGLPEMHNTFVYSDAAGFIWIGGSKGLYRSTFPLTKHESNVSWTRVVDLVTSEVSVMAMTESPKGTYWLGTRDGVWRYYAGTWQQIGLPDISVSSIFRDYTGTLWVGTEYGDVYTFAPSQEANVAAIELVDQFAQTTTRVTDFAQTSTGEIWCATWGEGISSLTDGQWRLIPPHPVGLEFVHYIHVEGESAWLRGHDLIAVTAVKDNAVVSDWTYFSNKDSTTAGLPAYALYAYVHDTKGHRQVLTNYDIEVPAGMRFTFETELGMLIVEACTSQTEAHTITSYELSSRDTWISALAAAEHDIWLGTETGLIQIAPDGSTWRQHQPNPSTPYVPVNTILPINNTVWIGTHGQGIYLRSSSVWEQYLPAQGLSSLYAHTLTEVPGTGLVTGSASGVGGLSRYTDGKWQPIIATSLPDALYVYDTDIALDNTIWIASNLGIYQLTDEYAVNHYDVRDGLPAIEITSLFITADNTIWAGSYTGISKFDGKRWSTPATPFATDRIWDIAGTDASLAVVSHQGLWLRRDGNWQQFNLPGLGQHSLPPAHLTWASEHTLWISAGNQLFRLELSP